MDIDNRSFDRELLNRLREEIRACDFIAMDMEFTGIYTEQAQHIRKFDSLEDIYQKMKHSVLNFMPPQIGLALCFWNAETQSYIIRPYNFYVSKGFEVHLQEKTLLQNESVAFLSRNGFDFQRVFKAGISYEKLSRREELKSRLENRDAIRRKFQVYFSAETKAFFEEVRKKIAAFVDDPKAKTLEIDCITECRLDYLKKAENLRKVSEIERLPFVINKVIGTKIVLKKTTTKVEEEKKVEEPLQAMEIENESKQEENILEMHMGFTNLVEEMIKSRKPLIGHNMILDLLFLIEHFIEDLPPHYVDFVKLVDTLFPNIYDNKVLARKVQEQKPIRTDLTGLFVKRDRDLKGFINGFLDSSPDFDRYSPDKQGLSHEAGYDAYMTAVLFIGVSNYLTHQTKSSKAIEKYTLPIDWTAIGLFRRRVHPCYHFSLADIDYESLEHVPEFNRTAVFFRLLNGSIQQRHLEQLEKATFLGDIEILLTGSSIGFIHFLSGDMAEMFLTSEIPSELKEFRFSSYQDRERYKAHKLYNST